MLFLNIPATLTESQSNLEPPPGVSSIAKPMATPPPPPHPKPVPYHPPPNASHQGESALNDANKPIMPLPPSKKPVEIPKRKFKI